MRFPNRAAPLSLPSFFISGADCCCAFAAGGVPDRRLMELAIFAVALRTGHRGRRSGRLSRVPCAAGRPGKQVAAAWLPGTPRRVGPPGPQPGASAAGRGEAQRSRLDLVRHDSATGRARQSRWHASALDRASSPRSQVAARSAIAAACLTWERPSVSVRRRPPLVAAIVTHLVTLSFWQASAWTFWLQTTGAAGPEPT